MPAPTPGGKGKIKGKDLDDLKDVHRGLATWMEDILGDQKVVAKSAAKETADIPVRESAICVYGPGRALGLALSLPTPSRLQIRDRFVANSACVLLPHM